MHTEEEFDYQAYMKNLAPGDENAPDPIKMHRGPGMRQERREAAKARISQQDIIATVAQFHARLAELEAEKKPFLYRGQPESHWPVNCSAVRRLTGFATNPIENQLIDHLLVGYLEYLIDKARRRGLIPSHLGESATDLELVAHLQHQGAATGLIDFTRQPLAALWFACKESGDKDGAVYVLPHSEVTEIKHRDVLEKKIQSFYGENKLWSWEPPLLGNRIVAQGSVFVFGVLAIPLPKMEKLTIPAACKNSILSELETVYGINEEELFPDFSGYAVANSSRKAFDVARTTDYWKEQIDSANDRGEKVEAHFRCGVAFSAIQEYEEAIKHYDEAIGIGPPAAHTYTYRGIAKGKLGRYEEAIADYSEAIRIDPQLAEAYNNRGNAKTALDRHEEAIADYGEAIRINPQLATAYNNRGSAKAERGQYEEAIADYDEAIRIAPQYAPAYNNRGNAKNILRRHEEAIEDCDKAIDINSKFAAAYNNRGVAKDELGRHEEAIADYDHAIRLNPQYAKAYKNREVAKEKLQRTWAAE